MKRTTAVYFLLALFLQVPGWADEIEVRGKGIMNGVILSNDDQEVRFKDSSGATVTYKKKDVLFLVKDDREKLKKAVLRWIAQAIDTVKRLPHKLKKGSANLTDQFIVPLSKPLDRSAADRKADELAKTMDDASKAAAAMHKKVLTANAEVRRQSQDDYKPAANKHHTSDSQAHDSSSTGHFQSLN